MYMMIWSRKKKKGRDGTNWATLPPRRHKLPFSSRLRTFPLRYVAVVIFTCIIMCWIVCRQVDDGVPTLLNHPEFDLVWHSLVGRVDECQESLFLSEIGKHLSLVCGLPAAEVESLWSEDNIASFARAINRNRYHKVCAVLRVMCPISNHVLNMCAYVCVTGVFTVHQQAARQWLVCLGSEGSHPAWQISRIRIPSAS